MACSVAGISTETYKNWRSCEPLFNAQAERAVAEGVQARLKVVEKCAFESEDEAIRLRAACWMLEHVHPEHFAKNRIELTGADGAPLAAGIQLYLPKKDGAPAGEVVETRELTEGETSNGNGR
jgi:hypothetical protein